MNQTTIKNEYGTWYLYSTPLILRNGIRGIRYFFSKRRLGNPNWSRAILPKGYEIEFNSKNGVMPYLKKKKEDVNGK
jgi:hypothetical protein